MTFILEGSGRKPSGETMYPRVFSCWKQKYDLEGFKDKLVRRRRRRIFRMWIKCSSKVLE